MDTGKHALEAAARTLASSGRYDDEALRVNQQLAEVDPGNVPALNRLGECLRRAGRLDEAAKAFERVLTTAGDTTAARIARNGLARIEEDRHPAPPPMARRPPARSPRGGSPRGAAAPASPPLEPGRVTAQFTGWTRREFDELARVPASRMSERFGSRVADLVDRLNGLPSTHPIVDLLSTKRPLQKTLFKPGRDLKAQAGQWHTFHAGGRWEPQWNLGMFSAAAAGRDLFRIGLGFQLSASARDPDAEEGQPRVAAYFARFQRALAGARRQWALRWLDKPGRHIQHGHGGPARHLSEPEAMLAWIAQADPDREEFVFLGHWLDLGRPDDAAILADRTRLVREADQAFRDLLPLWSAVYRDWS
jgi:hypothetical protein